MKSSLASERLTVLTCRVLRYGVLASIVLIGLGTISNLAGLGSGPPCPSTLEQVCSSGYGKPDAFLGPMFAGIASLNSLAFVEMGVILLLTLPFFRIFASIVTYLVEKDGVFTAISSFVLAVLLFSALVVGPLEAFGW